MIKMCLKFILKLLGVFVVLFFVLVLFGTFNSKKTYEHVAEYKNDLGFTFMDFVKRYNSYFTMDSVNSADEKYMINHKNMKETVHKNGIIEIEIGFDKTLDIVTLTFYIDEKSNKVKEMCLSSGALSKNKIAYHALIFSYVISAVNNEQYENLRMNLDKSMGNVILKSLDYYNFALINDANTNSVVNDKFEYSVLTSKSSSFPILLITIKPKER